MLKHTDQKSLLKAEVVRAGLVWLSLVLCSTSAFGQDEYLEKSFFLPQLRVQIALKAFSERTALPAGDTILELPAGLYALQFLVYRRDGGSRLYCSLKVYLDNSLRPYAPRNSLSGSLHLLRAPTHFFFEQTPGDAAGWAKWNKVDKIFSSERESEFFRSAAISSADYEFQKKGEFNDFPISEFHREILPGVAYLMLSPDCNVVERLDPGTKKWKLWIKREGAPDYRNTMKMEEKEFIVFELPRAFLDRIRPFAARVLAYNRANLGKLRPSDR